MYTNLKVMERRSCMQMNPAHRRKDSGEIDVFEAARYFSSWPEPRRYFGLVNGRKSLDICMRSPFSSQAFNMVDDQKIQNHIIEDEINKKKKNGKLPRSPGGKLASFLNSLFSQASSKKKPKSAKDEEEASAGGKRRRRSSISHFRGFGIGRSKPFYSSSKSETNYDHNGMKCYDVEDDRRQANSVSSFLQSCEVVSKVDESDQCRKHRLASEYSCFGKEMRTVLYDKIVEKKGMDVAGDHMNSFRELKSQKGFARVVDHLEMDEGEESDSSSDLFDLPNYDLGHVYSNGLPVYETTHLKIINRKEL